MSGSINLTNSYQDRSFIKPFVTQEIDKDRVNEKAQKSLSKDRINHLSNTLQSQVQQSSSKETLLSLQEFQKNTSELLNPQKAEGVTLQKESEIEHTPRLSWLIGRDDSLYNKYSRGLSNGALCMSDFRELVARTVNNKFISLEDQNFLRDAITGFQDGLLELQRDRAASNDPIVRKVIEDIIPKNYEYIKELQNYLEVKPLNPEERSSSTSLKDFLNYDVSYSNTERLLKFLTDLFAKSCKWYKWHLEDNKTSINDILLTKAVTSTEVMKTHVQTDCVN